MRIGSITIFHLSKLWKAKFFVLCDVIFLAVSGCRGNLILITLGRSEGVKWQAIFEYRLPVFKLKSNVRTSQTRVPCTSDLFPQKDSIQISLLRSIKSSPTKLNRAGQHSDFLFIIVKRLLFQVWAERTKRRTAIYQLPCWIWWVVASSLSEGRIFCEAGPSHLTWIFNARLTLSWVKSKLPCKVLAKRYPQLKPTRAKLQNRNVLRRVAKRYCWARKKTVQLSDNDRAVTQQ